MQVGDKVIFFDENNRQFKGIVDAIKPDKLHSQTAKVIRSKLIDVKVSRMPGTFQIYKDTPLKQDLQKGEKTFYYELLKKEKPSVVKSVKPIVSKNK